MAFENLDGRFEARPEGFSDFVNQGFTTELASEHRTLSVAILANFRRVFGPSCQNTKVASIVDEIFFSFTAIWLLLSCGGR
jgi:hypothetical protein